MNQFIKCPECGSIELATIEETIPFWSYIHDCTKCDYTIMESEWQPAKAISIRQPWAYLIGEGIKDIENRTWKLPEKYKGKRVLVHAGAQYDDRHRNMSMLFTQDQWNVLPGDSCNTPNQRYMIRGVWDKSAIIGSVEIVDCVQNHKSIWAEKQHCTRSTPCEDLTIRPNCWDGCIHFSKPIYNWVLASPILLKNPILDVKGKLSFFIPQIPDSNVD